AVAVSDGVGGASFDAVSTKNAARIVDVIRLGVAFPRGDSLRLGIFSGFDVNTIRGTRGCAKIASDALFESVFVALQHVDSTVTRLNCRWRVRKTFRSRLAEHGFQRNAEALEERYERLADFSYDRCHRVFTLAKLLEAGKLLSTFCMSM